MKTISKMTFHAPSAHCWPRAQYSPQSLLAKGNDTEPPNIILILADDLSYWDISHFGQKEFSTPNIDRMAREGMVFSNAYAAAPECAPSRAGLLTGRDMGHCTFRRLMTDVRPKLHKRPYLLPDDETIAHVLGFCRLYDVSDWKVARG